MPDESSFEPRGGEDDAQSAERLLPIVYEELRRLARRHMRGEAAGRTLQTTGLVHEAYLRLLGSESGSEPSWESRAAFLAAAATAMRRILVERARARGAAKRGGEWRRLDGLDLANLSLDDVPPEVAELDVALSRLERIAPEKAQLVSLRVFSGLTVPEAAAVLGISRSTAERYWTFARTWLLAAMEQEL